MPKTYGLSVVKRRVHYLLGMVTVMAMISPVVPAQLPGSSWALISGGTLCPWGARSTQYAALRPRGAEHATVLGLRGGRASPRGVRSQGDADKDDDKDIVLASSSDEEESSSDDGDRMADRQQVRTDFKSRILVQPRTKLLGFLRSLHKITLNLSLMHTCIPLVRKREHTKNTHTHAHTHTQHTHTHTRTHTHACMHVHACARAHAHTNTHKRTDTHPHTRT